MNIITVLVMDIDNNDPTIRGMRGAPEPLIYTVSVDDPTDEDQVREAVAEQRSDDLGFTIDPDSIVPMVAFPPDTPTLVDWRTG